MSENAITQAIADQFKRTLKMFRGAALAFPAEEWRKGDIDYFRPAGVAYHVCETIDFYTGDQPADQFPWGGRFGVGWEDSRSSRLPSQEQLLTYLDEMERKLEDWLQQTDLMSPEGAFPYTGAIILGRAMYVLRHTQHHMAQMSLELTRRGYPTPEWR